MCYDLFVQAQAWHSWDWFLVNSQLSLSYPFLKGWPGLNPLFSWNSSIWCFWFLHYWNPLVAGHLWYQVRIIDVKIYRVFLRRSEKTLEWKREERGERENLGRKRVWLCILEWDTHLFLLNNFRFDKLQKMAYVLY